MEVYKQVKDLPEDDRAVCATSGAEVPMSSRHIDTISHLFQCNITNAKGITRTPAASSVIVEASNGQNNQKASAAHNSESLSGSLSFDSDSPDTRSPSHNTNTKLAVKPTQATQHIRQSNMLKGDGINSPHTPILYYQCAFFTDNYVWRCIKCNALSNGKKLTREFTNRCSFCMEAKRECKYTRMMQCGPNSEVICWHPMCANYYGHVLGTYFAEGTFVGPVKLITELERSTANFYGVQDKLGPAYGPPVTYPPYFYNNTNCSPRARVGEQTKDNGQHTYCNHECQVGDWLCFSRGLYNADIDQHCHN